MVVPFLNPGMVEARQFSRLRIDSGYVGSPVAIAVYTRKGEIVGTVSPAVFLRSLPYKAYYVG